MHACELQGYSLLATSTKVLNWPKRDLFPLSIGPKMQHTTARSLPEIWQQLITPITCLMLVDLNSGAANRTISTRKK